MSRRSRHSTRRGRGVVPVATPAGVKPSRLPRLGRRTLLTLFAALVLLAAAGGLSVGSALGSASLASSVTVVSLTRLEVGANTPSAGVQPDYVLHVADGELITPSSGSSKTVHLPPEIAGRLRDLLYAGVRDWSPEYTLPPSRAGQRFALEINGSAKRLILMDSPFSNERLPDSLYRFLAIVAAQGTVVSALP